MANSEENEAARNKMKALARWESEGGGLGDLHAGDTLDETELRILARLGAAVPGEWSALPAALQRAIYARTSTPYGAAERTQVKAALARFLEDHANR